MTAHPDFSRFETHAASDIGRVRAENQDCCGVIYSPAGVLLAVCDGMGGHEGGGIASKLAMEALQNGFKEFLSGNLARDLESAVYEAGRTVRSAARESHRLRSMGTTCVAALIGADNSAHIANVGDSRAYLLRGGVAAQITRDHTVYEEQQRSGMQFMAENTDALRHVLTRCLGMDASLRVDMFEVSLQPGDMLLLCSDGLMAHVPDEDFAEAFEDADLATGTKMLIECANARGGCDNTSIVVLRWAVRTEQEPGIVEAIAVQSEPLTATNSVGSAPAGDAASRGGGAPCAMHEATRTHVSDGLRMAGAVVRARPGVVHRHTLPLWFRILKPTAYALLFAWIGLLLFVTFFMWRQR